MLHIGLPDLLVIYLLPLVVAGVLVAVFLLVLYVLVKTDAWNLAFSEDLRQNIRIRKRKVGLLSVAQVMLFESGVQAAFLYRCGRFCYYHRMKGVANVLHKLGKYLTNVDLSPTAKIGPGVVFLHCCNIVVTPYVEIGSHVTIRPFTVLRGWGTVKLEDGVRTGLQSCVMDCVTMGKDSESAPGAIVTQDVPANNVAYGVPAKKMVPKPASRLQGVVLELENVLLDSGPLFRKALTGSLAQAGAGSECTRRELEDLPPALVLRKRLGKDPVRLDGAMKAYLEAVRADLGAGLKLRVKGRDLLEMLRERGLKVALISRQPEVLAREMVDCLGLAVDYVCGADAFLDEWKPVPWIIYRPMRELKLGVERVVYVGGSLLDVRAGIEAAVRVFWVAPAEAGGPSRGLVNRYSDLASLLEEFSKPTLPPVI